MDLIEALSKIEQYFEDAKAGKWERGTFETTAPYIVDNCRSLSEDDAEQVRHRIVALANDLRLPDSRDFDNAAKICLETAKRCKDNNWFRQLIEGWPAPIAHEVRQLVAVLDGEGRPMPSPEAALLQLRDVSEALVKLPAAIMARRLIEGGGDDAAEMRRLLAGVSGGGWNNLAREASERLQQAEPKGPLLALARLFESRSTYRLAMEDMTSARNAYLGHGALRSNPSETASLVSWLTARTGDVRPPGAGETIALAAALDFAVKEQPWLGLRLECESDEGAIDLTGAAALDRWAEDARHDKHEHLGRRLAVQLAIEGGAALQLGPLVAARICRECGRRDVFFFDHVYNRNNWKIDFIDYGRGHKTRLDGRSEAADLRNEFVSVPLEAVAFSVVGEGLDAGTVIMSLDRMRIDKRYRSPKYLRDDFVELLRAKRQGIYWLQAPAHVGKTTLVQGLAESLLNDAAITAELKPGPGGSIAAYYCKREYREGRISFLNGLSEALKDALDLRRDNRLLFPDPRDVIKSNDPRQAFVEWLNAWQILANRRERPLLIAIDGLDEADTPSQGDSLLDLLPRASSLTPGLYLLLTSRRIGEVECPQWLGPALTEVLDDESCTVTRRLDLNDAGYHALLTAYVRENLEPENSALIEALITQAEGRFVFLSFLVEQLRGGQQPVEEIGAFGKGQDIYDRFIDRLEARYGSKRADDLLVILGCLSAAEQAHGWIFGEGAVPDQATGGVLEPLPRDWPGLSLELLATVAQMDEPRIGALPRPRVAFVEALILLQGVLMVWRGDQGGSRYRLGLKELGSRITLRRPDEVTRGHAMLAAVALDAVESLDQASSGGQVDPTDKQILRELFALLPASVHFAGEGDSNSSPGSSVLSDAKHLSERFRNLPVIETAYDLEFAREEAGSLRRIAWLDGILAGLTHGAGLPQQGAALRNALAAAYMNRGNAKQDAPGHGAVAAIADYDRAIALQEALRDVLKNEWPLEWRNFLADAFMNRGTAKQAVPGHGLSAAIADYDRAIALREALRDALKDEWPLEWRNDLASTYMNRGAAKKDVPGHGPTAAIADYDCAIALRESLRDALKDEWPLEWRNGLASAYMNRGNAKQDAPGQGAAAAIADYDHAIVLREALRDALKHEWPIPWRNDLAATYMNRGVAKQTAPAHGAAAAIADYDRAIALRESLRDALKDEWPLEWRNDLAATYLNRGNAKQTAPGQGAAAMIADYDRAIALGESLRDALKDECPLKWRNSLASAYTNRGAAKQTAPGHGATATIADYDRAIAIQEELRDLLKDEWPPSWQNDLAGAYMNRGAAKQIARGQGADAAIADYDRAIALREALRDALKDKWPPSWQNDLAATYLNRGNAKQTASGQGAAAAIADYDRAIALRETLQDALKDEWPLKWRNDLAGTYMNRGNAKQASPGQGAIAAISDYDRAIVLREALRDELKDAWPISWRNDLAIVYVNRGVAKQTAPGQGAAAAIADYDCAITLQEALREALSDGWPLPWRNDLAAVYINRGVAKQDAQGQGAAAAIADYDRAIALGEGLRDALQDEWPLPWRNGLVSAYMNRSVAKQTAPGHGAASAIADYDRAIVIRETLRDAQKKD